MIVSSAAISTRTSRPFIIICLCECANTALKLLAEFLDEGSMSSRASLNRNRTMPQNPPLDISFVRNSSISSKEYFEDLTSSENIRSGSDQDSPSSSFHDSSSGCDSPCSSGSVGSSDISDSSFVDSLHEKKKEFF